MIWKGDKMQRLFPAEDGSVTDWSYKRHLDKTKLLFSAVIARGKGRERALNLK
jgi:hypothetical protein